LPISHAGWPGGSGKKHLVIEVAKWKVATALVEHVGCFSLQFSSITAPVHTEGIYFLLEAHIQVESIEEGIDSPGRRQA
jgi:hypothetical protein